MNIKSSQRRCSVKKGVLENLAIFTGMHLCWSLSIIKLQVIFTHSDGTRRDKKYLSVLSPNARKWPATLLKRDSNTGVFL